MTRDIDIEEFQKRPLVCHGVQKFECGCLIGQLNEKVYVEGEGSMVLMF